MNVAVYPGSFDPITNGHLDVIVRAAGVFDRLIVAVLENPRKAPLLSVAERVEIIRAATAGVDGRGPGGGGGERSGAARSGGDASGEDGRRRAPIEVEAFDGLTVEFCRARGARFIVRGLRAISDFESEMQLAHNNRKLAPEVDTVFFMTALEHAYVSSSLVKEIAAFGGDVSAMVPPAAADRLRARLRPSG
ncbi:MAG TPA: pantetheine-phosphate adenylyltransferase [Candidatus Limnocylindrales bacterium]|nr:pantetheine-phosphate adenylyltransferase [Candidatus Limnocylindrales bacterium]